MQYVPGTTLDRMIGFLGRRDPATWSGRAVVEAIDALSSCPLAMTATLQERELLAACDFEEAVCWMGARLALALAHAHRRQVLHRDIKPANILVSCYGRPMLADFNLALDPRRVHGPAGEIFGGTLAYMAPEHLDAMNPEAPTSAAAVDERSDVYALGLVLCELLTGQPPFRQRPRPEQGRSEALLAMAAERRAGLPSPAGPAEATEVLHRVIRRCLAPEPGRRYQTATELARALDGCRDLRRVARELPAAGPLTRAATRHPFFWIAFLALLPNLLGSAVNISYNTLRIDLSPEQQVGFGRIAFAYNAVAYPLALGLLYFLLAPAYRAWRARWPAGLDNSQATALRHQVLRLPGWIALLSALGWLSGGVLFPLAISWVSGPLRPEAFGHFFLSFTIFGLIAMTNSVSGVQFVVLRVLYPRLWGDGQELRRLSSVELRWVEWRLRALQLLAGVVPLVGTILMVGVGPEQFTPAGYRDFRLLVTALIILGSAAFAVTLSAGSLLGKTVRAFLGAESSPPRAR
jgi:hypothetical protein